MSSVRFVTRSAALRIALWLAIGAIHGSAARAEPPPPTPRLGVNLSGPADWNTELPFVNVFRFSRAWISQKKGEPFGGGPPIELDAHGWVRKLDPDCWAETPLCTIPNGHWPAGRYTVEYDGRGKVAFWGGAASLVDEAPGRTRIDVDPARGVFFLRILETDSGDYVRNIKVIMPGFESSPGASPWNPAFLNRWAGVSCFRFMDFMSTNGSRIARWDQRPVLEDATFAARGVPLELMIDLCNRQKADGWFCIPHMADDDYVRRFAETLRDRLSPDLRAHIEYSNEVWNPMFPQHAYAAQKGIELGLSTNSREAAWLYTSVRSVGIFRIFEEVFGGVRRLVRVLPAQFGNAEMASAISQFRKASLEADAIAIAPYFGMNVPEQPTRYLPFKSSTVACWTLDDLFAHLRKNVLPENRERCREFRLLCDELGLDLVAYEGGQHLVGVQGGENNERLTALFHATNADPRMGGLYRDYLAGWEAAGGSLFCHFSSVSLWTKWGSWGALQFSDEDESKAPKFQALREWAEKTGRPIGSSGRAK